MREIICILIVFSFFISCKNKAITKPITVDYPLIDVGKIMQNDSFVKSIKVSNLTDKIISIDKSESSCGCTSVFIKDKIIQPKKFVKVLIKYQPHLSNDSGKVDKFITFRTSYDNYFLTIHLKSDVQVK